MPRENRSPREQQSRRRRRREYPYPHFLPANVDPRYLGQPSFMRYSSVPPPPQAPPQMMPSAPPVIMPPLYILPPNMGIPGSAGIPPPWPPSMFGPFALPNQAAMAFPPTHFHSSTGLAPVPDEQISNPGSNTSSSAALESTYNTDGRAASSRNSQVEETLPARHDQEVDEPEDEDQRYDDQSHHEDQEEGQEEDHQFDDAEEDEGPLSDHFVDPEEEEDQVHFGEEKEDEIVSSNHTHNQQLQGEEDSEEDMREASAGTANHVAAPPRRTKAGKSTAWMDMYQRLVEYKNKHGDCLVPAQYNEDPKLGRWVTNQRHRREPLSDERKDLLHSVGFVWRVKERAKWDDMFIRLKKYKAKHGDCRVPQKYKEDPRLGEWVQTQRRDRTRTGGNDIFAKRRAMLNSIGFEWFPHQLVWDDMYQRLVLYKEQYGNCLVPRHHQDDPKLGRWVDQQRVRNKKGGLPPERKEQLDSLGFVWSRA